MNGAKVFLTERRRAYLYRILIAAVPLLGVYGFVDSRTVPLITSLLVAVFGFGLAAANTSTKPPTE
jgi:hypothetical protein